MEQTCGVRGLTVARILRFAHHQLRIKKQREQHSANDQANELARYNLSFLFSSLLSPFFLLRTLHRVLPGWAWMGCHGSFEG